MGKGALSSVEEEEEDEEKAKEESEDEASTEEEVEEEHEEERRCLFFLLVCLPRGVLLSAGVSLFLFLNKVLDSSLLAFCGLRSHALCRARW